MFLISVTYGGPRYFSAARIPKASGGAAAATAVPRLLADNWAAGFMRTILSGGHEIRGAALARLPGAPPPPPIHSSVRTRERKVKSRQSRVVNR